MSSYTLTTDATQISNISSMRVMVSAALLYTFTVSLTLCRYIISLWPLSMYSKAKSKWNACMTMVEDLFSMELQVDSVVFSSAQYKLPKLWYLPLYSGLGDADLRLDNSLHVSDSISKIEPPKHSPIYLLHSDRGMVLRDSFLLHVQRNQLIEIHLTISHHPPHSKMVYICCMLHDMSECMKYSHVISWVHSSHRWGSCIWCW